MKRQIDKQTYTVTEKTQTDRQTDRVRRTEEREKILTEMRARQIGRQTYLDSDTDRQ